jgi:glycosyltransferase involved in cell wall biosynthesis
MSVLLPVRDAGRYLRRALDDALAQRGVRFEVVAVDDGSTDASGVQLRRRAAAEPRLRVLTGVGRGAAAALERALAAARAPLVTHMEADDRCPPDRLRRLRDALARHPEWDGVVSRVGLIGAATGGMRRYVAWQNALLAPEAMARARFVEIPALHQAGLYRRARLEAIGGYRGDPRWPVDIDFWMRWFAAGATVGKIPRGLYHWRQHPRQSTRTSPLHRLEALRACKARYFVAGPGHGRPLDVYSVGRTLAGWCAALRAAGAADVRGVEWRAAGALPPARPQALRVFVYGTAAIRARVAAMVGDGAADWFAA